MWIGLWVAGAQFTLQSGPGAISTPHPGRKAACSFHPAPSDPPACSHPRQGEGAPAPQRTGDSVRRGGEESRPVLGRPHGPLEAALAKAPRMASRGALRDEGAVKKKQAKGRRKTTSHRTSQETRETLQASTPLDSKKLKKTGSSFFFNLKKD